VRTVISRRARASVCMPTRPHTHTHTHTCTNMHTRTWMRACGQCKSECTEYRSTRTRATSQDCICRHMQIQTHTHGQKQVPLTTATQSVGGRAQLSSPAPRSASVPARRRQPRHCRSARASAPPFPSPGRTKECAAGDHPLPQQCAAKLPLRASTHLPPRNLSMAGVVRRGRWERRHLSAPHLN